MNTTISDAAVECGNCHEGKSDMDHVCPACNGTGKQPAKPEAVRLRDELRERTPVDYAIEHAGYLVTAANQVIEARNELDALMMRQDEGGDVGDDEMQAAQEAVGDASHVLRLAIHEFEKRRDRALAATGKQQVGEVQGDALLDSLVVRWRAEAAAAATSDNALCQKIANCTMRHAAELKDALAARQPDAYHGDVDLKWLAGSIGEVAHRLRTFMPNLAEWSDRARDCGIAAKVLGEIAAYQPVGQRPVAKVRQSGGFGPMVTFYPETFYGTKIPDGADLFLRPTAQALDLAQFRVQVAELLRSEFDLEVADPEDHRHDDGQVESERLAARIAALIDGQAVQS